jgi:hypothetical protein
MNESQKMKSLVAGTVAANTHDRLGRITSTGVLKLVNLRPTSGTSRTKSLPLSSAVFSRSSPSSDHSSLKKLTFSEKIDANDRGGCEKRQKR